MKLGQFWVVFAGVSAFVPLAAPTQAAAGKTSCEKIFKICMKRAGSGHAAICEDLYSQAKRTGVWPATEDEHGKKYAPVPCIP